MTTVDGFINGFVKSPIALSIPYLGSVDQDISRSILVKRDGKLTNMNEIYRNYTEDYTSYLLLEPTTGTTFEWKMKWQLNAIFQPGMINYSEELFPMYWMGKLLI